MATMLRVMLGAIVALSLSAGVSDAHEAESGRIQVVHPWALPAKAGEATKVYMTITNGDAQTQSFFGLRTPEAGDTRIRFASPTGTGTLDSLSIEGEGQLGFGTSHMWIELIGLRRALVVGESFPATLEFADYTVPISVVVGVPD